MIVTANLRGELAAVAAPDLRLRQNNFDLLRFLFAFTIVDPEFKTVV